MDLSRRRFIKLAGVAGAATVAVRPTRAEASSLKVVNTPAVLVDTTRCAGCRACEAACSESNALAAPAMAGQDAVFEKARATDVGVYTVVNRFPNPASPGDARFVKRQCMHCLDPACVSACMLGALKKGQFGVVSYDPDLCIGCRYCQMSCPFNIPKFEWSKVFPKIVKCEFCKERLAQGQQPGCCEACPTGAVIFGKYTDLLADAHARLAQHPERYVPTIYGESEVGGTQVLYLSHVDFAKLGLPTYTSEPVPTAVRQVFQEIYQGIIPPLALYALLAAVLMRSRRELTGEAHDREEQ